MEMKSILYRAFAVLLALSAGACAHHKIIPDEELALIFHDAFLTNAYIAGQRTSVDSLMIYEPIFARYGYTTADVQYTIGNFSKRKSARLGDIVERAIERLEQEGKYYNGEVAVLDTIDNVASRSFTRRVRADSLIRVRTLRDTSALRFSIDVVPGRYRVRMNYRVDSLDRNEHLRAMMWLVRRDSSATDRYSVAVRRDREESVTREFTADSTHCRLQFDLLHRAVRGPLRQPSVTIRDLVVEYTPPAAAAVDSLYLRQLDIRIFADEFFRTGREEDRL